MMFGFILFPFGLLGVGLIAAVIFLIRGKVPRRSWLLWAGVPLGCACLPIFMVLALIVFSESWDILRPHSWAFEEVFAVPPPHGLTGLKAHTAPGLDSRVIYLALDSTPAMKTWTAGFMGWQKPVPRTDWVDSDALRGDPPDWWKGASAQYAPHRCARPVHREFQDVGYWQQFAIIDCLSDQHVYVIAQHLD